MTRKYTSLRSIAGRRTILRFLEKARLDLEWLFARFARYSPTLLTKLVVESGGKNRVTTSTRLLFYSNVALRSITPLGSQIFSPVVILAKSARNVLLVTQSTFSIALMIFMTMFFSRRQNKVFYSVIPVNSVSMMNLFVGKQIATNSFFHYQAVLKNIAVAFSMRMKTPTYHHVAVWPNNFGIMFHYPNYIKEDNK